MIRNRFYSKIYKKGSFQRVRKSKVANYQQVLAQMAVKPIVRPLTPAEVTLKQAEVVKRRYIERKLNRDRLIKLRNKILKIENGIKKTKRLIVEV